MIVNSKLACDIYGSWPSNLNHLLFLTTRLTSDFFTLYSYFDMQRQQQISFENKV